jgi:hypothetical protein
MLPYLFALLLSLAATLCTTSTSYAGWWQDPALGNTRGAATGNEPILNSPYYNPNLPAGGLSPYAYNPTLPYGGVPYGGAPVVERAYATPYGTVVAPTAVGNGFYNINYGNAALRLWRAPSGYYYPWSYGAYPTGYSYPVVYQSGRVVQASPPVTTIFSDMQNYLDDSKSRGRLADSDYQHLNRRLHDLIGKTEEINSEGNSPDQDPELQEDVKELNLDIAHRIKSAS